MLKKSKLAQRCEIYAEALVNRGVATRQQAVTMFWLFQTLHERLHEDNMTESELLVHIEKIMKDVLGSKD